MGRITELLKTAQQRAQNSGLAYQGALTPPEALEVLKLVPGCRLIDVRSRAELELVGAIPDAVHIEWAAYPGWHPNPYFLNQLKQSVETGILLLFICRNGNRSHKAAEAATLSGFLDCYNVLEGFEGDVNPATNHRSEINGWKILGLPWAQK